MPVNLSLAPRRLLRPYVVVPFVVVVAAAVAVPLALSGNAGTLTVTGPANDAVVGTQAVHHGVMFTVRAGNSRVHLQLDGRGVTGQRQGTTVVYRAMSLRDGRHTFAATAGNASVRRTFTVDTTPPTLSVSMPTTRVGLKQAVDITGTVTGANSMQATDGTLRRSGNHFTVHYAHAPAGALITAMDAAGNRVTRTIDVPVTYPTAIRAVHMTGAGWNYGPLRRPVLRLAQQHRINAVELDIKDEDGVVNFDVPVALAHKDHAIFRYYDARAVANQLHHMGVRLIGRIVTFNDSKLANWAWTHGHRDWVIQTPHHTRYSYGYAHSHFGNFANRNVQDYDIAIAAAAARAGFDDIVFDYIRRPDGPISTMRFPGIVNTTPAAERAIDTFCERARAVLRPLGAYVGAAIFAEAATNGQDTAQNVAQMARHLDVVEPMDYPSHWLHGEYHVKDPNADPYDIVHRSLKSWLKAVRGTTAQVVPWLQAEDYGGVYTPAKVRAQIRAARDDGIPGFILWNAVANYTRYAPALPPTAPRTLG